MAQAGLQQSDIFRETYVIDSKGTTVYRDGVRLCAGLCPDTLPLRIAPPSRVPVSTPLREETSPPAAVALAPQRPPAASAPQVATADGEDGLTKEQKAILLNAGVAAAITTYGVAFWDYFQTSPKADSEGWFGRTTKHGGADKLGHFWGSYSLGHLFSYVYRRWDFDRDTANALGAASSLGMQTLMELGDAFSGKFGFSYEDELMNVAGAAAAYILGRYPSLADKIDFRLLYTPAKFEDLGDDILTDYENQRYILAVKLDGFEALKDTYLSYVELHAGYFTRNYEDFNPGRADNRERNLYFGVGLNVTKLIRKYTDTDFAVFDYIQVPYTTVGADHSLDR